MLVQSLAFSADQKPAFGDCVLSNAKPTQHFQTKVPGVLTIAGPIASSPTGYRGSNPSNINGGDLYCLTAEIAYRGGLTSVKIVNLPWDALISGNNKDFDFTVMNVAITPERQKVMDFSIPYRTVNPVVVVKGNKVLTESQLKTAKVGIIIGAKRYENFLKDTVGVTAIQQFDTNADMLHALMAGFIDAAFSDSTGLMPAVARSNGAMKVIARYDIGTSLGVMFPKGSPNVALVDSILNDMKADGTLAEIERKWLLPVLGGDPVALPVWGK